MYTHFRVPISAHVCECCAQNSKRMQAFSSLCVPGTRNNWVLPGHLCKRLPMCFVDPPFRLVGHCQHRKRYLTFLSLRHWNQVKLRLSDRKENQMQILRKFLHPNNVSLREICSWEWWRSIQCWWSKKFISPVQVLSKYRVALNFCGF